MWKLLSPTKVIVHHDEAFPLSIVFLRFEEEKCNVSDASLQLSTWHYYLQSQSGL